MKGEIDTKSIESVQAALSLFGEKGDHKRNSWSPSSCNEELGTGSELQDLLKDLANVKVQLEAKDSAYKQALLKLDYYKETSDELSFLLQNCEFEKDKYLIECREARIHIYELQVKVKEMADKLPEIIRIREQIGRVMSKLKATQRELLALQTRLSSDKEAKNEDMMQAELAETSLSVENKEICTSLSDKEAKLQLVIAAVTEAEEKLEPLEKQFENLHDLKNQLLAKFVFVDNLQLGLDQGNELRSSPKKAFSDAITEFNDLKAHIELQEDKDLEQAVYIFLLETEVQQLGLEHNKANEVVGHLNFDNENLKGQLEKIKREINEIRERDNEAGIEKALLKSELHRGRSKTAAAEAAAARATSEKSAFYLSVQQLSLEAAEAKKEIKRLKNEAGDVAAEEIENPVHVDLQHKNSSHVKEAGSGSAATRITISLEEYMTLLERADRVTGPMLNTSCESESLMKELEIATVKISEFRTRAEQAVSRAEVAEKAKASLEAQINKWREQKERRRAASAALREESFSREISSFTYGSTSKTYQPLGKVLNMKF